MGRGFCRKLSLSTNGIKSPHHYIRIGKPLKKDLEILAKIPVRIQWENTLAISKDIFNTELQLFTDSSSSIGMGAYFRDNGELNNGPRNGKE